MNKYKKTVVVEAIQFTDANRLDILKSLNCGSIDHNNIVIHTQDGNIRVTLGEWIVRNPEGKLSICKNDVFMTTHEIVQ